MEVVMDTKQLVREIFEMVDSGDFSRARELIHEDFIDHGSPLGDVRGPEGFQAVVQQFGGAFSEGHSEIDLLIVEGDLAAWRSTFTGVHTGELMGQPPTGRRVSFEILNMGRTKDGKAVEHWGGPDVGALMAQLGVSQAA
jgi:predicted ester cyclase